MRGNVWGDLREAQQAGFFDTFVARKGNVWYVDPQRGKDESTGDSWNKAVASMSVLDSKLGNNDIIVLSGVLREQWVTPQDVFDVTVIGQANRSRQATDSGVPTGGGASWLAPSSPTATTPLVKVREQGWKFVNIQFAPVANSACIRFSRAETAADMDGSHGEVENCHFTAGGSGGIGIEDVGGCGFVKVHNSRFQGLAFALKGISTGIAVPLMWEIINNVFKGNTNDVAMSLSYGLIQGNVFMTAGSGSTNKVVSTTFVSAQGGNNQVIGNYFTNTEAQIAPGNGFTGAASDVWRNFVTDQADMAIGQPA